MHDEVKKLLELVRAVRAREPLTGEVARWIVALALSSLPATERESARNDLLRQAAAASGARTTWKRMLCVRTLILEARRLWTYYAHSPPRSDSAAGFVYQAMLIDPGVPASERQLFRILAESEKGQLLSPNAADDS